MPSEQETDKYPSLYSCIAPTPDPLTPDPEGTAHRTSEKQKPGPLDLALLFKEVLRVKKGDGAISVRECLFASVAEYNKKYGTTKAAFLSAIASNVWGTYDSAFGLRQLCPNTCHLIFYI